MPARISSRAVDDDPLTILAAPPPNESNTERETRLSIEREAKRVSDAIDVELEKQKAAEKKASRPVKVLLLGQSESGKSTTLKNFQLMCEPKAFRKELASWRAIIQLNVVRSIHVILDALNRPSPPFGANGNSLPPSPTQETYSEPIILDAELLKLKSRLAPLIKVEETLIKHLTPNGSGEYEATHFPVTDRVGGEVAINSTVPWKDVFTRWVGRGDSLDAVNWDDPNDPGRILHECADDMKTLWRHKTVHQVLERQNLRLEEMAGFFLDCLDEVTSARYVPTDDHILRARIKTLGVSEHRVRMSTGGGIGNDWRIFDVGGHRSLRAAWAPYFDDMDSIIFLAPISAFDQVLAEAPKVNRLEDSVLLWTSIVSNKLLQNTNIILFLNKCDIMKTKLASGIKLKDYVVSYGNRANDFETASNYLRKKFAGILKENSTVQRNFYCHLTSVVDMTSTRKVIANIKDMILREHLKSSTLMM